MNGNERKINYSIEMLRVVFTLYIVLRHTLAAVGIQNNLWLGVEFFFVLSGFMIAKTFNPCMSVFGFVVKKYLRFAPLVLFGCVLCAFVRDFDPLSFIANLLLVSETGLIVGSGAYDPPTWYLSVLLWGGGVIFMSLKQDKSGPFVIAFTALIGMAYLQKYGYEEAFGNNVPQLVIPQRFIRGCAEMSMGCIVAKFYMSDASDFLRRKTLLRDMLFWVALVAAVVGPWLPIYDRYGCISCLVIAYAVVVFFFAIGDNVFNLPFWSKISRYALSVFVVHYVSTFLLFRYRHIYFEDGSLLAILSALGVSILLGVAGHHLVELPAQRLISRFMNQKTEGFA